MDLYGLIGFPLAHSFSSRFFNDKFERESIDAKYLNFEIQDLKELHSILQSNSRLKGLNVTIPHKENVIPFLDSISPEASSIGAVNTIRIEHKDNNSLYVDNIGMTDKSYILTGHNTDYVGFRDSIHPLLNTRTHRKALVLGTGGASKAIVYALDDLSIEWKYVSRNPSEHQLNYSDLTSTLLSEFTIIINASPVGTYPNHDQCPAIPYDYIGSNHLLYDLVYNPEETLFLKRGKEQNATIKNGLEMLERQALAAWDFWRG